MSEEEIPRQVTREGDLGMQQQLLARDYVVVNFLLEPIPHNRKLRGIQLRVFPANDTWRKYQDRISRIRV